MSTRTPKILIVSHGHPALAAGSAQIAAYDLFRNLNQSGAAEASFLGCVNPQHRPPPAGNTVQEFEGGANEYLLHVDAFDPFMLAHGIDSRSLDDFGHLLDMIKPDLVHIHHLNLMGAESIALIRNRLPGTRIVFTLHDFHPICHRDGLMIRTQTDALCDQATPDACHGCFSDISAGRFALRRQHLENMFGLVDRFIAPSVFLRQRYSDWGIPDPLIEWIPAGLPDEVRACQSDDRRPRNRFGYFGSIAPENGPLVALDALKHVDPTTDLTLSFHGAFQFQGDEFYREFDQALEREGDRARYEGPYSRRNIAQHMEDVDWVIVPSIWWENAPLTILESFRLGRPVITSNVGGMAEIVDHGVNGFQFSRHDPVALAKVMEKAAKEDGLWNEMVSALPDVPSMTDVTARHVALYGDLIDRSQKLTA